MPAQLKRVVIAYESEAGAAARLVRHGYPSEIAAEVAVYLAQATDLAARMVELADEFARHDLSVDFVELGDLPARTSDLQRRRDESILWCQTDGIRFYRGSSVPALARLVDVARYGAPPPAQHLCQDKFASLALAASAGLRTSPTLLLQGSEPIASLGQADWDAVPLFVKPATLGAKIGIFADSRCRGMTAATVLAGRLWERYRDRALVQPFVEGDDVRVSYLDAGGTFEDQLGIARLAKNPASETGGAFLTMRDNQTLSGASDTAGGRGGFGAGREAAFVPGMVDLRTQPDDRSQRAVATILDGARRLSRLLRLQDYFSMDFRIDAEGAPTFFEFEVCPAVTIYDFGAYLATTHGLSLGAALARSLRLAYARRDSPDEG